MGRLRGYSAASVSSLRRLGLALAAAALVWCLASLRVATAQQQQQQVRVGVILNLTSTVGQRRKVGIEMAAEDYYAAHPASRTRLALSFRDSTGDVVGAASAAVDLIKNEQVQAILGPHTSAEAEFVAYLGNSTHVPVLSSERCFQQLVVATHIIHRLAFTSRFAPVKAITDLEQHLGVFNNVMEHVSKDGPEQHLGVSCPQYMLPQVIEIPPRSVLLEAMEVIGDKGSYIFKSIPGENLHFQASEQVIEIPPRRMLLKVMEAIGSKVEPIFTCTPCGSLHFKASVQIDVPRYRFSDNKPFPVATVEGEICDSQALAETSAAKNALKYLGHKHSIQVMDYSSSIVKMLAVAYVWRDIHEIDDLFNKMIGQWDFSLKQCDRLSEHLDYKVIMENSRVLITESSQIYTTMDEYIIFIIKMYSSMPVYARSELEKIHEDRMKYSENSSEKHKFVRKVHYSQSIWLSEKDVLDYALSYLGMGKAEYSNARTDGGNVEGVAKFSFPCRVEGRFHQLEIHSKALASCRSEEVAARAALLFMESKLNLKIVDLNYADRQIAENKHKFLESIKYRYLEVAHHMKTELGNMLEFIAAGCAAYIDPRSIFGDPLSQEQMMAAEFCSKSLEVVRADCARRYQSSKSMFEQMEKLI